MPRSVEIGAPAPSYSSSRPVIIALEEYSPGVVFNADHLNTGQFLSSSTDIVIFDFRTTFSAFIKLLCDRIEARHGLSDSYMAGQLSLLTQGPDVVLDSHNFRTAAEILRAQPDTTLKLRYAIPTSEYVEAGCQKRLEEDNKRLEMDRKKLEKGDWKLSKISANLSAKFSRKFTRRPSASGSMKGYTRIPEEFGEDD